MSAEYTIEARDLRHAVRSQVRSAGRDEVGFLTNRPGAGLRCFAECGVYVDNVLPDAGVLVVTCVRCLVAELRYLAQKGEF